MNRNDYQSGWDTDQFPNSPSEAALAYYEVLMAGGFTTGGTNFDAKAASAIAGCQRPDRGACGRHGYLRARFEIGLCDDRR